MALIVYKRYHDNISSIENFIDSLYQSKMSHLASDLIAKGVDKEEIKDAMAKAIVSAKNAGLTIKEHFKPVFTTHAGTSFADCRMTKLGYTLVLLNCRPNSEFITTFQHKLIAKFL